MSNVVHAAASDLPANVARVLDDFLRSARTAYGDDLVSVILYGSAAEGRLRPTSDVNLLLLLAAFDRHRTDAIREPARLAEAAIRLRVMFLLRSELPTAAVTFAEKFADMRRRHRVLYGQDALATVAIPRAAEIHRLQQVLMNLVLRMRQSYVARSQREEQLALALADFTGPMRSCAAALLELEGTAADSPKSALERLANDLGEDFPETLVQLSSAREQHALPAGIAPATMYLLLDLAMRMHERARALS